MGTILKIGIVLLVGFCVLLALPTSCTDSLFGSKKPEVDKKAQEQAYQLERMKLQNEELQRKLDEANKSKVAPRAEVKPVVKPNPPATFGGVRNSGLRVGKKMK